MRIRGLIGIAAVSLSLYACGDAGSAAMPSLPPAPLASGATLPMSPALGSGSTATPLPGAGVLTIGAPLSLTVSGDDTSNGVCPLGNSGSGQHIIAPTWAQAVDGSYWWVEVSFDATQPNKGNILILRGSGDVWNNATFKTWSVAPDQKSGHLEATVRGSGQPGTIDVSANWSC